MLLIRERSWCAQRQHPGRGVCWVHCSRRSRPPCGHVAPLTRSGRNTRGQAGLVRAPRGPTNGPTRCPRPGPGPSDSPAPRTLGSWLIGTRTSVCASGQARDTIFPSISPSAVCRRSRVGESWNDFGYRPKGRHGHERASAERTAASMSVRGGTPARPGRRPSALPDQCRCRPRESSASRGTTSGWRPRATRP